ncbi:hypothetical protein [Vibrio rotiferianus]|uniref:hypothetical protein n=1 Tax=Vibrio rotiferianus TaxID=190895 RepID=UPI00406A8AA3
MAKLINPSDKPIVQLLQQQGFIKSEVKAKLKQEVYRLHPSEVDKVNNYAKHFGIAAKAQLIDEILQIRHEVLLRKIADY